MLFTILLRTLALAVIAQGATIPQDTPDGLYRSYIDERGLKVRELLSRAPLAMPKHKRDAALTTRNEAATILQARDDNVHCGCGFGLGQGDCDAAVADLTNQLNGSGNVGANMAYYSIRGGVVAFACNATPQDVAITGDLYGRELGYITSLCGRYTAGSFANQGFNTGYMQYYDGQDFCANALGSNAHSC